MVIFNTLLESLLGRSKYLSLKANERSTKDEEYKGIPERNISKEFIEIPEERDTCPIVPCDPLIPSKITIKKERNFRVKNFIKNK